MTKQKEPARFDCPYCKGEGTVSVPGITDGKFVTTAKPCKKCRGTGKLVLVNDNAKFKKK